MAKLNLLPLPKSVREAKGNFRLEGGLPIILSPGGGTPGGETPGGEKEANAAWSLAGEADRKAGVTLAIERMGKLDGIGRRILLLIAGRDEKLYPALKRLAAPLAKAPKNVRDQAYVLRVTKDEVVATARSARGLYYAAQTLRQLLTKKGLIPCVTIADWPTYVYRGVMLDISRYKVPKLEALFERIERLASLKINVFQLYTEHTFGFRRHPKIAEGCDPITAEDVMELDEFCKEHFVDLQANLQSFGHQGQMLALPEYNDMAESPQSPFTMSPAVPRTYRMLDDMYAECLPAYSSKLFNACCDETWDLGKGRSKRLAKKTGVARVYLGHIKRINGLAHKYGKRMMIWGDIVLQHPEMIPDIPKDIIMLDWGYSANANLSGEGKFAKAGLEHWTCPGVSTWQRIFAHFKNASGNIAQRAVRGAEAGATGLLNTEWGDGGHPQMPSSSYRGYAWGAEQSWTPCLKTDPADFTRRFAWAWFEDETGLFGKLYAEAEAIAAVPIGRDENYCRCYGAYWQPFPMPEQGLEWATAGKMAKVLSHVRRALGIVSQLADLYPEHCDVLVETLFGLRQMAFVTKKVELSRKVNEFQAAGKKLPANVKKQVRDLLDEWLHHKAEFEQLWMIKSRRSQIAFRLGQYDERAEDYRKVLN